VSRGTSAWSVWNLKTISVVVEVTNVLEFNIKIKTIVRNTRLGKERVVFGLRYVGQ
jgi:hypothetical protein